VRRSELVLISRATLSLSVMAKQMDRVADFARRTMSHDKGDV
jgi:hypothetical protein